MTAWLLFKHALGMLWRNPVLALKVSLGPSLAATVVFVIGMLPLATLPSDGGGVRPIAALLIFLVALIASFILMATAVNWHRAVLLQEPVGWIPRIRTDRIIAYFLRALLMSLLLGIAGLAVGGTISLLASQHSALMIAGVLIGLAAAVLLGVVYWRLAASLPGAAIDDGAGIAAVWRATADQTGTFVLLSVILWGFLLLIGLLTAAAGAIPVLGVLVEIAANWFVSMLVLSLLTTIYGHYVEGRTLV